MTEYYKTTSDTIKVADSDLAEQLITEYNTVPELTLTLQNDHLTLGGEWIFALQHESTLDDDHMTGEPISNMDFLADVVRITEDSELPFTVTEICQGTLDEHPGLARFEASHDSITMTYGGGTKEWETSDFGILTTEETK